MDGELLCKVIQGVETVARVKAFLVFPVAALHLAVMAGRVGTDELEPDAQRGGSSLKQGGQIPPAVGKAIGELGAIVSLDAFHSDSSAGIPLEQLFEEVGRGIGRLLRVGSQEAQASELINGSVLEQAELRVRNAPAGHHFHVHLYPLAGIGHLLVRLGLVRFFLPGGRKQPQFTHDPEQTLGAADVAPLPQPVPQLYHAQVGVAAAHIPD